MLLSRLMFGWDEMSPPHGSVRLLHIPLEFLHGDFLIVWQIRSPLSIYVIVEVLGAGTPHWKRSACSLNSVYQISFVRLTVQNGSAGTKEWTLVGTTFWNDSDYKWRLLRQMNYNCKALSSIPTPIITNIPSF